MSGSIVVVFNESNFKRYEGIVQRLDSIFQQVDVLVTFVYHRKEDVEYLNQTIRISLDRVIGLDELRIVKRAMKEFFRDIANPYLLSKEMVERVAFLFIQKTGEVPSAFYHISSNVQQELFLLKEKNDPEWWAEYFMYASSLFQFHESGLNPQGIPSKIRSDGYWLADQSSNGDVFPIDLSSLFPSSSASSSSSSSSSIPTTDLVPFQVFLTYYYLHPQQKNFKNVEGLGFEIETSRWGWSSKRIELTTYYKRLEAFTKRYDKGSMLDMIRKFAECLQKIATELFERSTVNEFKITDVITPKLLLRYPVTGTNDVGDDQKLQAKIDEIVSRRLKDITKNITWTQSTTTGGAHLHYPVMWMIMCRAMEGLLFYRITGKARAAMDRLWKTLNNRSISESLDQAFFLYCREANLICTRKDASGRPWQSGDEVATELNRVWTLNGNLVQYNPQIAATPPAIFYLAVLWSQTKPSSSPLREYANPDGTQLIPLTTTPTLHAIEHPNTLYRRQYHENVASVPQEDQHELLRAFCYQHEFFEFAFSNPIVFEALTDRLGLLLFHVFPPNLLPVEFSEWCRWRPDQFMMGDKLFSGINEVRERYESNKRMVILIYENSKFNVVDGARLNQLESESSLDRFIFAFGSPTPDLLTNGFPQVRMSPVKYGDDILWTQVMSNAFLNTPFTRRLTPKETNDRRYVWLSPDSLPTIPPTIRNDFFAGVLKAMYEDRTRDSVAFLVTSPLGKFWVVRCPGYALRNVEPLFGFYLLSYHTHVPYPMLSLMSFEAWQTLPVTEVTKYTLPSGSRVYVYSNEFATAAPFYQDIKVHDKVGRKQWSLPKVNRPDVRMSLTQLWPGIIFDKYFNDVLNEALFLDGNNARPAKDIVELVSCLLLLKHFKKVDLVKAAPLVTKIRTLLTPITNSEALSYASDNLVVYRLYAKVPCFMSFPITSVRRLKKRAYLLQGVPASNAVLRDESLLKTEPNPKEVVETVVQFGPHTLPLSLLGDALRKLSISSKDSEEIYGIEEAFNFLNKDPPFEGTHPLILTKIDLFLANWFILSQVYATDTSIEVGELHAAGITRQMMIVEGKIQEPARLDLPQTAQGRPLPVNNENRFRQFVPSSDRNPDLTRYYRDRRGGKLIRWQTGDVLASLENLLAIQQRIVQYYNKQTKQVTAIEYYAPVTGYVQSTKRYNKQMTADGRLIEYDLNVMSNRGLARYPAPDPTVPDVFLIDDEVRPDLNRSLCELQFPSKSNWYIYSKVALKAGTSLGVLTAEVQYVEVPIPKKLTLKTDTLYDIDEMVWFQYTGDTEEGMKGYEINAQRYGNGLRYVTYSERDANAIFRPIQFKELYYWELVITRDIPVGALIAVAPTNLPNVPKDMERTNPMEISEGYQTEIKYMLNNQKIKAIYALPVGKPRLFV